MQLSLKRQAHLIQLCSQYLTYLFLLPYFLCHMATYCTAVKICNAKQASPSGFVLPIFTHIFTAVLQGTAAFFCLFLLFYDAFIFEFISLAIHISCLSFKRGIKTQFSLGLMLLELALQQPKTLYRGVKGWQPLCSSAFLREMDKSTDGTTMAPKGFAVSTNLPTGVYLWAVKGILRGKSGTGGG